MSCTTESPAMRADIGHPDVFRYIRLLCPSFPPRFPVLDPGMHPLLITLWRVQFHVGYECLLVFSIYEHLFELKCDSTATAGRGRMPRITSVENRPRPVGRSPRSWSKFHRLTKRDCRVEFRPVQSVDIRPTLLPNLG